uniref:Uncharacterized protein n=1 Tax=Arundo donax TaxID=35708 RepID=A0A0A9G1N5_ARUDO
MGERSNQEPYLYCLHSYRMRCKRLSTQTTEVAEA